MARLDERDLDRRAHQAEDRPEPRHARVRLEQVGVLTPAHPRAHDRSDDDAHERALDEDGPGEGQGAQDVGQDADLEEAQGVILVRREECRDGHPEQPGEHPDGLLAAGELDAREDERDAEGYPDRDCQAAARDEVGEDEEDRGSHRLHGAPGAAEEHAQGVTVVDGLGVRAALLRCLAHAPRLSPRLALPAGRTVSL